MLSLSVIGNIMNTIPILRNLFAGESQPEALRHVADQRNRSNSDDEFLYGVSDETKPLPGAPVNNTCSTIIQVDEALART